MKELSFEAVGLAKTPVEDKVPVLLVQHDRMTDTGEVEPDLMHPSRFYPYPHERRAGEFLFNFVGSPGGNRFSVAPGKRNIDQSFLGV